MIDLCNIDNILLLRSKVKERCKFLGVTQGVMLSNIGYSNNYLNEAAAGRRRLTEKDIYAIADYLRTTPDYLMGLTDNPNSDKQSYDDIMRSDEGLKRLVDRIIATGVENRGKVWKFLDMLE